MKRWRRIGLSVVVLVAAGPVLPGLAFPGPSAGASWRALYRADGADRVPDQRGRHELECCPPGPAIWVTER